MRKGFLSLDHGHRVYYEVHGLQGSAAIATRGNCDSTAVVLHGGPGGGLDRALLDLFDLTKWRVVLYDQRGCGRSTPHASTKHNTTWDLIADLERLRDHLGVNQWLVFGGSWGSTLALAYASRHGSAVTGMILRGVCLMEPWEQRWLYEEGGASRLFPEAWGQFCGGNCKGTYRKTLRTYGRLLRNRKTRKAAAARWWAWEETLSHLDPRPDCKGPKENERQVESLAVLEHHYFSNNAWLKPKQLLRAARHMSFPVIIVQGRYDLVCPPASAVALANALPQADLRMTVAGHAASEPATAKALKQALTEMESLTHSK